MSRNKGKIPWRVILDQRNRELAYIPPWRLDDISKKKEELKAHGLKPARVIIKRK